MSHLRYANIAANEQVAILKSILQETDWMMEALTALQNASLPDGCIVAGAIYNLVWNHLTGRESSRGIKDIDVFYCDPDDLSWEAENSAIKRCEPLFANLPIPAEIRNQSRVHLWFPDHFGFEIPPIINSSDGIRRFSSRAYCVGARLADDNAIEIIAPYGLADLFACQIAPNHYYGSNGPTHEKKAARALSIWPELTVIPWNG